MDVSVHIKSHPYKTRIGPESSSEGEGPLQVQIVQVATRILRPLVSKEVFGLLLPILFS